MAINLSDNIQTSAPKPTDSRYLYNLVPYTDVNEANSVIVGGTGGVRYIGLTVNIDGTEYWYKDGIDDIDLVEKTSGGGTITGGTNGLSTDGANIILGGTLLSGTTITIATGTTLTIEDLRTTTIGLQYAGDYEMDFTSRSLVTKLYVDSVATGLDPKLAVEVATTLTDGDIDLTGGTFTSGSTIDNIVVLDGWRVLIKNQTLGQFNGIWVYSGSSDTFYRSEDFDEDSEVIQGALVPVITGNTNRNTLWVLVTSNPITVDTTPLEFTLFSSPILTEGLGISISGVTISVDGAVLAGNSIVWTGDTFNVDATTGTLATALATKLNVSTFSGYTGTTETRINNLETWSGETQPIIDVALTGATFIGTGEVPFDSIVDREIVFNTFLGSGDTTVQKVGDEIIIHSSSIGTITGGTNGLGSIGADICLGGTLDNDTTIDGDNYTKILNITGTSEFNICSGSYTITTAAQSLCFGTNGVVFTEINETPSCGGIKYFADYSVDYTNRSLVDKEYVDNCVGTYSGITTTALTGATNGLNYTGQVVCLGGNIDFSQYPSSAMTIGAYTGNSPFLYMECNTNNSDIGLGISGDDVSFVRICKNNITNTPKLELVIDNNANFNRITLDTTTIELFSLNNDVNIFLTAGIAKYNGNYESRMTNANHIPSVGFVTGYTQSAVTQSSNVLNVTDFTTTGYTATTESDFIGASGGTTIYLPNPPKSGTTGQRIVVADIGGNALTYPITIDGNGNNILNALTATINTDYGSITFIFNSKGFWSTAAFIN